MFQGHPGFKGTNWHPRTQWSCGTQLEGEQGSRSAYMCARMCTQAHEDSSRRPSGYRGDRSFQIPEVELTSFSVYCCEHGSYGDIRVRVSACPQGEGHGISRGYLDACALTRIVHGQRAHFRGGLCVSGYAGICVRAHICEEGQTLCLT